MRIYGYSDVKFAHVIDTKLKIIMDRIKRLWPFKSATNFTLTVFGIATLGLGYIAISKESQFGNPVIA